MSKSIKLLLIFILIFILFTSSVFATDAINATVSDDNISSITSAENNSPSPINSSNISNDDLVVSKTESYTLDNILYGNAFISTNNFTIDSRNHGGIVSGDIFASTVNTTIKSDLVYSNTKDKLGNYLVESTNSFSRINGNVYILATDTFTLESKCEIHGDLYVFANVVNIDPDSVINGNLFVVGNSKLNLHGKVSGSVYAITDNFMMNYTGYIERDLSLTTKGATIAGTVNRNAKVNSDTGNIVTTDDFIVSKDLFVRAEHLTFAGEVKGNANLAAKTLIFKTDGKTCIIHGNLDYATKSDLTILDGIVTGEISTKSYIDRNSLSYTILSTLIAYLTLLIYIFAVALFFNHIAPDFIKKLSSFASMSIVTSLGIGFALILLLLPTFILLLLTKFTVPIILVIFASFLFVSSIANPLFILAIANVWKNEKFNLYIKMLIITTIIFIISCLPTIGLLFMLLFTLTAIGRIISKLFNPKES